MSNTKTPQIITSQDEISSQIEGIRKHPEKSTITFIDRKKSKPVLSEYYNRFKKYFLYLNYKEEKITFRIIYDKIYRPNLFNFIVNGSEKNINLTRNIFTINEDKYPYELLKDNEEMKFDDDELYNENSYLKTIHKYFLIHKLTIYLSIPMCVMSLYYKFAQNNSTKVMISLVTLFSLCGINMTNKNNQNIFSKREICKMAVEANRKNAQIYKNFFYDL